MRAVVESARMTELAGISADRVSSVGWALSSILAGMAGVLLGPLFPQLSVARTSSCSSSPRSRPPPSRACRASRSRSSAGSRSASAAQILSRDAPDRQHHRPGPAPVAAVRRALPRADPEAVAAAARRSSPIRSRASIRRRPRSRRSSAAPASRRATHIVGCRGVRAAPSSGSRSSATRTGSRSRRRPSIFSIIFLSITVFTGMAGEISLAQGAFAAIGAFTVGQLATPMGRVGVRRHGGRHRDRGRGRRAPGDPGAAARRHLPRARHARVRALLRERDREVRLGGRRAAARWRSRGRCSARSTSRATSPFFFLCLVFLARHRASSSSACAAAPPACSCARSPGSEVAASSIGISPTRARITAFAVCAGHRGDRRRAARRCARARRTIRPTSPCSSRCSGSCSS